LSSPTCVPWCVPTQNGAPWPRVLTIDVFVAV
jgi:hypothetical protein